MGDQLTDARLRELYEQVLVRRTGAERAGCVSPEAMLALVRREGAEDERLATLDHVMACDACGREFELLRAIEQAGAESAGAERAEGERTDVIPLRARARWQRFVPLALAASVLLAVGVGVLGRGERGDVTRGGDEAVALVAPPGEIRAGAPVTFIWHAASGATRYELEVLDPGGTPVFSAMTTDTTAVMPDVRRLAPGVDYRWWVRVASDAGAQRESPMRRLRARSP